MISIESVREAIFDVLDPVHFHAAPPAQLEREHLPADETPWEVHRGQLLPRHLTRTMQTFESWNVFVIQDGTRSGEPVLALMLDAKRRQLNVVRGLLCWTWEGYHAGDNVYLSREVPRWVRERVGTLDLHGQGPRELREAVASWLFRAVVGLSRLPLTSVEAPLPGFSLGELAYFYKNKEGRQETRARWLEFTLRSVPAEDIGESAATSVRLWRESGMGAAGGLGLLRAVFNDAALSPYTDFVDKTLAFLRHLVILQCITAEQHVDFIGRLLRQLARHLTAYDLFTFHHRGANYPDALLLDAAVKEYLQLLEQHTSLFVGDDRAARIRRRALRQAWLHRRRYEGHLVPDAPTSPGENMRVLPPPHVRVPEEQIVNPGKRTRRLYRDDPLPDQVGPQGLRILQQCGRDLQRDAEARELGMALFIERPLGTVKFPGEPDLSPLLAHEAYSQSLAERGLMELAREPLLRVSADDVARSRQVLYQARPVDGLQASLLPAEPQCVVSLADATRAASDFVILRTLPGSVQAFCDRPDVAAVLQRQGINLAEQACWLVVGNVTSAGTPGVLIRDAAGNHVLQLEVDASQNVKLFGDVKHE
jgi:hypothetical protein